MRRDGGERVHTFAARRRGEGMARHFLRRDGGRGSALFAARRRGEGRHFLRRDGGPHFCGETAGRGDGPTLFAARRRERVGTFCGKIVGRWPDTFCGEMAGGWPGTLMRRDGGPHFLRRDGSASSKALTCVVSIAWARKSSGDVEEAARWDPPRNVRIVIAEKEKQDTTDEKGGRKKSMEAKRIAP